MSKLIKISYDLSDIVDEFKLTKQQENQMADSVVKALTLEIYRNWSEAAKRELHSTRMRYIKGLSISYQQQSASITLLGSFNNMIESGASAFDMKNGFMKSSKVKMTKKGKWYLTIPFRFATPDALGENEVFSDVLPQEIYDIVKNFSPKQTSEDGQSSTKTQSLSASQIPTQFRAPKTRNSVINEVLNKTFDNYTHKTSIYEGITRDQKTYERGTQSSYTSFRRVSENSDPMAWIHSGIQQHNFAQKGVENTDVDVIVDNVVDKTLFEFGF